MYDEGLSMGANSSMESSCFGFLGVNVFSYTLFCFVQAASPLVAEGSIPAAVRYWTIRVLVELKAFCLDVPGQQNHRF